MIASINSFFRTFARVNERDDAINVVRLTSTGNWRENNEDSFCVTKRRRKGKESHLMAVADGMGGREAGEIASATVVGELTSLFKKSGRDAKQIIPWALKKANKRVYTMSLNGKGKKGMGTTCTLVILEDGKLFIGHVGDSRAYLLRDGMLLQLTEDQTLVTYLVKTGQIEPSEAEGHPHSHVLTQAIGTKPYIEPELWLEGASAKIGDKLIICSDGLYNEVSDDEIQKYLESYSLEDSTSMLMELALSRKGQDNITLIGAEICQRRSGENDSGW